MMSTVDIALPPHAHLHPTYSTGVRRLRVAAVEPLTDTIRQFRFVSDGESALASYQPGSHVIITTGQGRNAYSLTGDGICPAAYEISVMRRGAGGGSDWLHNNLKQGSLVEIEGPRSAFAPVLNQHHAVLVAGGIGITPILSHARARATAGASAEIIYSYRSGHAAHLDDVRYLARHSGIELIETTSVEDTTAALWDSLARQPLGSHAYACGPAPLLDAYREIAARSGWPPARVHLERFSAPEIAAGSAFTVTRATTATTLHVPPGVSLLERLLADGAEVPNMCRQGVCGECAVPVLAGTIEHRDHVLSDDEKAAGNIMLSCVSRGHDIEVDL